MRHVSTPRSLDLAPGVTRARVATARGAHAALVAGDPGGPVVLLVPGFTGSKEDFLAVLAPLAASGARAVAIDQRGQCDTPGTGRESDYTLDALAADLVAVAEALDAAPVHLVGHSLGGLVARAAVLAEPSRWASLVLLGSGPAAVPPAQHEGLQALREALPATPLPVVWEIAAARDRANGVPSPPPEVAAFLRRRFLANDAAAVRAKAAILLEEPDRVEELAAVLAAGDLPAAVVTGADDDVWSPAEQERMAALLHRRWLVVPGAGHSPAVDDPATTAAALICGWEPRHGSAASIPGGHDRG